MMPDTLMPQEQSIIGYVDQHEGITTPNVERILLIKVRRAREMLKEMTEKGLLKNGVALEVCFT